MASSLFARRPDVGFSKSSETGISIWNRPSSSVSKSAAERDVPSPESKKSSSREKQADIQCPCECLGNASCHRRRSSFSTDLPRAGSPGVAPANRTAAKFEPRGILGDDAC